MVSYLTVCHFFYRKSINYRVPLNLDVENPEEWQKEEQERIDTAEPPSEEQLQEKESLLQEGFSDWSRRDFNQFVRSCAEHGREDVDSICKDVEGKEDDDVRRKRGIRGKRGRGWEGWGREREGEGERGMGGGGRGEREGGREKGVGRPLFSLVNLSLNLWT